MKKSSAHEINEQYYDKLYRKKSTLAGIIYPFISYDQQSKSKANYFFLKKLVTDGISVLDYGFGHGSFLLKFGKKVRIYGVDISTEAVHNFPLIAGRLGKTVRTSTPDNLHEMIGPGSIDIICLSHVLEHVDDDRAILLQLKDFLVDKGYFLINVPINEVWQDPKHVRTYNVEKIEQLLTGLNMEIQEYFMFDKTTAFLLEHEQNRKPGFIKKLTLRSFRFMLSFVPFRAYRWLDKHIFPRYNNQQLVVLAKKK